MRLKRKFHLSYQYQLFLPVIFLVLLFIVAFSAVQIKRERDYKQQFLSARLDLLNQCAIWIHEKQANVNIFFDFIREYYDRTELDNISMTLYDTRTGEELNHIGFPTPAPARFANGKGFMKGHQINVGKSPDEPYGMVDDNTVYFYDFQLDPDEEVAIFTFLPVTKRLTAMLRGSTWWWWFLLASCLIVIVIIFIITKHLATNVKLLREFATNAANDNDFVAVDKFSNDDLGEISRQVVTIYKARKAAIASRELEHRLALKATENRAKLKHQMSNNINHELKTPAAIIKGYIETILENPDMDEASKTHFINKTAEHIKRLCAILDDISTMTRLEDGADIPTECINLHNFVANIEEEITESGIIGDMTFINLLPLDCYVKGNASLLNGALMNLIKNAVAYSRGSEMGIKLIGENFRYKTFSFYDNGTGVEDEHLERLFERFYRVDKGRSRKNGGTGLGLPIVRSSFSKMGGSISVRNRHEGGLEFIFTLSCCNVPTE